jgi:putative transposase
MYLSYEEMDKRLQPHEAYKALPAKVAQQVLKQVADAWKAFREARASYEQDSSKFTGCPKLPRYKHKTDGRNLLIYTLQALQGGQSKKGIQGIIKPSGLPITVKTRQQIIHQVHIIPRNGYYVVEVVYSKEPVQAQVDPSFCVAIDLGVTNLAAITSNREGFVPRLVNGRKLKSINQ